MSYTRQVVLDLGTQRAAGPATTGLGANISPQFSVVASTVLVAGSISSGALVLNTGVTGVVSDTAANYALAYPEMNVGDTISCYVTNLTLAAIVPTFGAGVTLVATGKPSFSIGSNVVTLTKTAVTPTYTLTIL
jgi:hypothetical protein